MPRSAAPFVGHAADARMWLPVVNVDQELFADPGAPSHASTSYVPARADDATTSSTNTAASYRAQALHVATVGSRNAPATRPTAMSAAGSPITSMRTQRIARAASA